MTDKEAHIISNRLSELSCDLDNFKKIIQQLKNAIQQSGYKDNLIFSETEPKKKARKRKIIWFNPPFNNYVANNIGRVFKINRQTLPTTTQAS